MTSEKEAAGCLQIIRKRRSQVEIRKGYVSLLLRILALAVCLWLIFSRVFLVMQASGNEMFPAVKDGDLLIGFRIQKEYLKNDVVIYEAEGKRKVGRILGKENDMIVIDENGSLFVNGTPQGNEILFPTYPKTKLDYPYQVPEGCVFLLGDYRTQSKDSRDFGCVERADVKAKVLTLFRRRKL